MWFWWSDGQGEGEDEEHIAKANWFKVIKANWWRNFI